MRKRAPLPAGVVLALLSVRPSMAAQLMIGQLEASRSSADWDEFSSAAPVSTYVVGNPSLPPFVTANLALVRSWLGNSTCNGCYSGITKKQRLKFEGLVAGRQYTVTVYASYWSGGSPFTATVVYGQGTVTAGATSALGSGYGAAGTPWKIAFVPATEEVTLELGNGATSGDAYMMLDAIAAEFEPLRVRMSAALVALGRTESTASAADWDEFTGTADVETYTVGDHLVPTQSRVRSWIGHSTCRRRGSPTTSTPAAAGSFT